MMLFKTFTLAAIAGLVIAVPTPAQSGGTEISVPQPPAIAAPAVPVTAAEAQDEEEYLQDLKELKDIFGLSPEELSALEAAFQDDVAKETDIATRSSGNIERRFFGGIFKKLKIDWLKILKAKKGRKGGRSLAARGSDESDQEYRQDLEEVAALLGLSSEETPEVEAALKELAKEEFGITARDSVNIERRFFGTIMKKLRKALSKLFKKKGGRSLAARSSDESDQEYNQDLEEIAALLGLSSEETPEVEAALKELAKEEFGITARDSAPVERRFFPLLFKLIPKLAKAIAKGLKKKGGK